MQCYVAIGPSSSQSALSPWAGEEGAESSSGGCLRYVQVMNLESLWCSFISKQDFEAVLTIDPDCHEAQVELEAVYEMIDDDEGSETGKTPSEDDFPSIDYPAKEFDDDSASATSGE